MGEFTKRLGELIEGREATESRVGQMPVAIIVASLECDEDFIISWLAYDPVAIHAGYTKEDFRKLGIMRQLVDASGHNDGRILRVTHWSKECEKLSEKQNLKIVYSPSLLHRPKHETM